MPGPTPAVAATRVAVRSVLATLTDDPRPPHDNDTPLVLVACSGGPDSLALAAATAFECRRHDPPVRAGAVVVDHGLQPGSEQVAERAAATCAHLGLDPVLVRAVTVVEHGDGPEAASRAARYAALDAAADHAGAAAVLLGHTLDDQAEQVLLGLARGSGARSLAGMAAARGRYRRPFLGLTRATVRRSVADLGLGAWEDPSNADPRFARVRARERVLPVLEDELGPGVSAALARSAEQLRDDADLLDLLAADLLTRASAGCSSGETPTPVPVPGSVDRDGVLPGGGARLDAAVLSAAPRALRTRALRAALLQAGSPGGALGRHHVLAVEALLTRWRGQGRVNLPGGVEAHRRSGMLLLARSGPAPRASRITPTEE